MDVSHQVQALRSQLETLQTSNSEARRRLLMEAGSLLVYQGTPNTVRRPKIAAGAAGIFVPENTDQEAALLNIVAAAQYPKELHSDEALFWRTCLAAGAAAQWPALAVTLPRAQLSALTNLNQWKAMCHALLAGGVHAEARLAMRTALLDHPDDVPALLMTAKACILTGPEHCKEAIQHASRALDACGDSGSSPGSSSEELRVGGAPLAGRALALRGAASFVRATRQLVTHGERTALLEGAGRDLVRAAEVDPQDAHVAYNLSVVQAHARNLPAALHCARTALALSGGSLGSAWAVVCLVLAAQGRLQKALAVAAATGKELGPGAHPLLLIVQARLELRAGNVRGALEALSRLRAGLQAGAVLRDDPDGATLTRAQMERLELQLWCELGRVFLLARQREDTRYCIRAGAAIDPWHPQLVYLQGRLEEAEGGAGGLDGARRMFESCRSVDVGFAKAAIALGGLHLSAVQQQQQQQEEEKKRRQQQEDAHSRSAEAGTAAATVQDGEGAGEGGGRDAVAPPTNGLAALSIADAACTEGVGSGAAARGGETSTMMSADGVYDLSTAEMYLKSAMQYQPDRAEGWYRLGLVYQQQNRRADAEAALRRAVGLAITAPVLRFAELPLLV